MEGTNRFLDRDQGAQAVRVRPGGDLDDQAVRLVEEVRVEEPNPGDGRSDGGLAGEGVSTAIILNEVGREKPSNLLGVSDGSPVDDPSLDEDPDLDLDRAVGVSGETNGDGGVVVNHVQRTEVH